MTAAITDMQTRFADNVAGGQCPTEAAREAGCSHPSQAAYKLMRYPGMVDAIRQARLRLLHGSVVSQAVQVLAEIMTDPHQPAGARVTAARTVLEAAGDLKRQQDDRPDDVSQVDLAQLSAAQIQAELARIQAELRERVGDDQAEADGGSTAVH